MSLYINLCIYPVSVFDVDFTRGSERLFVHSLRSGILMDRHLVYINHKEDFIESTPYGVNNFIFFTLTQPSCKCVYNASITILNCHWYR